MQEISGYKEYNSMSLVDKIPDELRRVNFYKFHNPAIKKKNNSMGREAEEFAMTVKERSRNLWINLGSILR